MRLPRYSIGMGDRFGRQGEAQLAAVVKAKHQGVAVTPVWNKSHREHTVMGSTPGDVRAEANAAVEALGWTDSYFVDADHVGLGNVDVFVEASDFFTLDVADFIGGPGDGADVAAFIDKCGKYAGRLAIGGIDDPLEITEDQIASTVARFLPAVREAGRIYRHIEAAKGTGNFITEVSMDETDRPQTPTELLFILAAVADEGVPVQTIAPKFVGPFNKGVDYAGDVGRFASEFERHLAVIAFATKEFGLGDNLKLSIHSGSDKLSLYGAIREAIKKFDTGLHLKTSGTTWLEEIGGLALVGGQSLALAKEIYAKAASRFDELTAPYAAVVDIDASALPPPESVARWDGEAFAAALRNDPSCDAYNPHFRQLLHVAYKVAAEMGRRFLRALGENEPLIADNVTRNLYERHIAAIFPGGQ